MLDAETVHRAIDVHMNTEFQGDSSVVILYGNVNNTATSEGQVPYIKQKVVFRESKQFELGNTSSSRNWGALVFIIHVRKGTGSLVRDRLYQRVIDLFRSKLVGGATFLNVQPLAEGGDENWSMSGYQIPFYFNSI